MRALRKGKEMVFEEKSNLLYYIGSIVQTVLGNLKGQNVIVMYPWWPQLIYIKSEINIKIRPIFSFLSYISVRGLPLPSTIVAWSSRLSGRGLFWPEYFTIFRVQKIFSNIHDSENIFQHSGFRKYFPTIMIEKIFGAYIATMYEQTSSNCWFCPAAGI